MQQLHPRRVGMTPPHRAVCACRVLQAATEVLHKALNTLHMKAEVRQALSERDSSMASASGASSKRPFRPGLTQPAPLCAEEGLL